VKWADFLPQVLPYTPGCPDLLAVDHIRSAAREFAGETGCWNYMTAPVVTRAGVAIYPLDVDSSQERVRLIGHALLGTCRYDVVDGMLGRAQARTQRGGRFVYLEGPQDVVIYPPPVVDGEPLVLQLAVRPSMTADYWPDDLAEHVNDIAQGAVATLCRLPKKEWSDRQQAKDAFELFQQAKGTVAWQVATGYTGGLRQMRHQGLR
jgi:hypothetical protein